ncbi:MFS general substrate transporter [Terfezia boudieri ATCC MYA-4762]|uniref:MFS general substrate transporter n=1 Tax=Terfezia boudieri ATCC MYA-4762 TaxID=1051890 RepID=A0A3N4LAA7_9PEZI|nr:MFS general substrate transporter [Terfezia boudieri ATCC MYA-4762]
MGPKDEEITNPSGCVELAEIPPAGAVVVPARQTWNNPSINKWRVLAAFYSFIILGMNDSAYGLETYYTINFTAVSLIFLTPFVGYIIAAFVNDKLHNAVGRRGVGITASFCHMASYIIMAMHPPYPALVVVMCLAGFGSGTIDAAWNSYIGFMDKSNEILGLLHGMYGIGAVLSPITATFMVTHGYQWYEFYYLMIGLAFLAVVFSGTAFWGENADVYRCVNGSSGKQGGRTRESMKNKVTRLIAVFLWLYIGTEVSLGGWIVTFMIRVRNGSPFGSGMVSAGFWIGLTVGRFTLGWVTGRFGEKLMVSIYLILAIALELIFWLVPQFYVSAVSVALLGFLIGPLFPSAMVAQTRLLPQRLHVSAVGFATAVGGSGEAIFPFAVGAIASKTGVQSLHPIILGLLVAQLGVWLMFPTVPKVHVHDT